MTHQTDEIGLFADALKLANTWRLQGEWQDAQTLLHGLQPVAARIDVSAQAHVWLLLSRVLTDEAMFANKDNATARQAALQQALALAESANNPPLLGDVHNAIGLSIHTDYLAGDRSQEPEDEMGHFEQGLELRRQGGTAAQLAESLFHVGLVHDVIRHEPEQAAVYHQQAYDLAMEANDKVTASYAIRHLGFTRWDADDRKGAAVALRESWQLREEAGFVPGAAFALITLAQLDEMQGDKTAALPKFQQARAQLATIDAPTRVQWLDDHIQEEYADAT